MKISSTDIASEDELISYQHDIMRKNSDMRIRVTSDEYFGCGSTYDYYDEAPLITVGSKRLNPDEPLTYGDMTTSLIAMYHEIGHARQAKYIFKEKNDLSTVLALNHYARKCSTAYYDTNNSDKGNYSTHTTEIAAQYYGLKMTYAYLSDTYDEKTANQLICDYVNNEVACNFIPVDKDNPYVDVNAIFEKYNDVFNERVYEHRSFDLKNKTDDDIYSHFGSLRTTAMLKATNTSGLRQDALLAKIYMEHSPEGEYLNKMLSGERIVKALEGVEFDEMNSLLAGSKHVPIVQRMNLDDLLPSYYSPPSETEYDY